MAKVTGIGGVFFERVHPIERAIRRIHHRPHWLRGTRSTSA